MELLAPGTALLIWQLFVFAGAILFVVAWIMILTKKALDSKDRLAWLLGTLLLPIVGPLYFLLSVEVNVVCNGELRTIDDALHNVDMLRKSLLILMVVCCSSCGQTTNNVTAVTKDSTLSPSSELIPHIVKDTIFNDTVFIHRQVTHYYYFAVYIDTTRQSKAFQRLTDFAFSESDKRSYQSGYDHIKAKYPSGFIKRTSTSLPKNWLPVYRYKNKYYLYAPCDWGITGRRAVNDSSFVAWTMDGPMPTPIRSNKQINKKTYELDQSVPDEKHKSIMTIHTIDPLTRLSVFEFSGEADQNQYGLYIPVENAKDFELIVNYCPDQKIMEFNFDKIDFQELLRDR